MKQRREAWYIRFPNGQEIKAKSTAAVIYHIQQGTIPKNSWARRSRAEAWMKLEWHAEFTEAVTGIKPPLQVEEEARSSSPAGPSEIPLSRVAERMDPMQLRTVGVRGLLDDLLAAIDSAFRREKLFLAMTGLALTGLVFGGIPYLVQKLANGVDLPVETVESKSGPVDFLATIGAAIALALTNAILTKMTYLEMSTSRAVTLREAARGIVTSVAKLMMVYIVLVGGAFYLMSLLHRLPAWITAPPTELGAAAGLSTRVLGAVVSMFGLLAEVILWAIIVLTWLLSPILVGEEYSLVGGIREWISLATANFNRIALAEVMTIGAGLLLSAPVYLPIQRALVPFSAYLPAPIETMALALSGTAFLATVTVGNVFIYLDAKYEQNEN